MQKQFIFTNKLKAQIIVGIALGLILTIIGFVTGSINEERVWSNILLNGFLILGLSLGGAFFVAVHLISESAWHTSVQRIAEAMGSKIWLGGLLIAPIIFGAHHLYHWTHTEHLDTVLIQKQSYLNLPFFSIRMLVYLSGWLFLFYHIRRLSAMSDHNPNLKLFKQLRIYAALFIVFFAITSSTSAWDWLMSIDAHWFSTLYGWYTFSGMFVNAIAVIIIVLIALQKMGYMQHVNDEHLHDLGKYLFAFSIFWAYLWISQYLLIWYSNIPEETIYYTNRFEGFKFLFYLNLVLCFIIPFFALMSRGNKRNKNWLLYTSIIVFIGHWIDLYLAIMPGTVGDERAGIGLFEIGITIVYISLFSWLVCISLSNADLVPSNHPYFKESFDYENIK
jgi:hypothetical protein